MIDWGTGYRWGHFLLLSLVAGTLLMQRLLPSAQQATQTSLEARALVGAALALAIGFLTAFVMTEIVGAVNGSNLTLQHLQQFLVHTWVGKVALARIALIVVAAVVFVMLPSAAGRALTLALIIGALAAIPAGGHAISSTPRFLSVVMHSLHTVAAGLWFGGVVALAVYAFRGRFTLRGANSARETLARFSPVAMLLMAVLISTGTVVAALQIGRPAALFGTAYGAVLLVKVAVFLVPALLFAAHLRFVYLRSAETGHNPWRALSGEAALAACVVLAAAALAQTIPGRHDAIAWLVPFRFAPEIAWQRINVPETVTIALGVAVAAAAFLALTLRGDLSRWRSALSAALTCILALSVAAASLAVEAYPTTFARSTSAFNVQSVAAGRGLFVESCAGCHGMSGHGDGPAMPPGAVAANNPGMADLTLPHTKDHTIGDLYWWISHGKPRTAMPGFESALAADDRWRLIDYLRVLSAGYQGRLIDEHVVPNQPWLPSIDFAFQNQAGDIGSLKEFRERASVLLAIVDDDAQLERIKYLIEHAETLGRDGLEVVIVAAPKVASAVRALLPAACRATVITHDTDEIALAWSEYRRTLQDPDVKDEATTVPLLEFLIDRFGYVRARWRSNEGAFADAQSLAKSARLLAGEPRILPPPDEHAH